MFASAHRFDTNITNTSQFYACYAEKVECRFVSVSAPLIVTKGMRQKHPNPMGFKVNNNNNNLPG